METKVKNPSTELSSCKEYEFQGFVQNGFVALTILLLLTATSVVIFSMGIEH